MAAGAAAAGAAIANAIKASGVLVRLEAEEFAKILARAKDPLVVVVEGGFFSSKFQYLTSYKGLAFYTRTKNALILPAGAEVVPARRLWIP